MAKEVFRMVHLTVFVVCAVLFAGAAHATTIDDAAKTALQNNPEMQALRIEEDLAKTQLQKARLLLPANPSVEGSASKKDRPVELPGGKYTNYGLKLTQEFEIAGQRGLRIDVAGKNLSKVAFEIRDKERVLLYEVRDAFARALCLKKKAELTAKVVDVQEELLNFTRIKYKAGSVSGLEVNIAEIEFGKAKRDLVSAERELKETLLGLQKLMGLRPDSGFMVEGELSPEDYPVPDKVSLMERATAFRPDVRAASLEVDRSERAIDLAKREAVPNINFGGFYVRDEDRNERGLLATVSIPLFDRKQAERKAADLRASQARIRRSNWRTKAPSIRRSPRLGISRRAASAKRPD